MPRSKQFKGRFAKDNANKRTQTWEDYWAWVKSFYKGRLFVDEGWAKRSKKLASTKEMATYANVLGRIIASEWAKRHDDRRIDTGDVAGWARALETASKDDAKGKKRMSALRKIADQIAAKLRP
jgi:hypothetical protein